MIEDREYENDVGEAHRAINNSNTNGYTNGTNGHHTNGVNGFTPPPPPPSETNRHQIEIVPNTSKMVDEVMHILSKYDVVFQHGGKLVELQQLNKTAQMSVINGHRFKDIASRYCNFISKKTKTGGDLTTTSQQPPDILGNTVVSRPFHEHIPMLKGLAQAPTLREDGTIIRHKGFDKRTGVFLASTFPINVPEHPTLEDAQVAYNGLCDLVCDFPFITKTDQSIWVASVLTVVCRHAFDGPAPIFATTATKRASGKSMLADIASIIANGEEAPRTLFLASNIEMNKLIAALNVSGADLVLLDNITIKFASSALDMALTAKGHQGRTMGKTEVSRDNLKMVWFANGNGLNMGADTVRRTLLSRLDPKCERPEHRKGPEEGRKWKFPHLLQYVKQNRARFLSFSITIVSAYIQAGCPQQEFDTDFGSFVGWSRLIRSAIKWCAEIDPCETEEIEDVDETALERMLNCWPFDIGVQVTAADLVEQAQNSLNFDPNTENTEKRKRWRNALLDWLPAQKIGDVPTTRELGYALRNINGTYVKGHKIVRGEKPTMYGNLWSKVII